jgi:hypothetical protein
MTVLSISGSFSLDLDEPMEAANFKHRQLDDGSWDCICLHCYATVINTPDEDGLLKYELKHDCHHIRPGEKVH